MAHRQRAYTGPPWDEKTASIGKNEIVAPTDASASQTWPGSSKVQPKEASRPQDIVATKIGGVD
jgi:hypothetical protein